VLRLAPQSPQNCLPDGLSLPQAGQIERSAAPHSPQNFLPSGLPLPHF
jgi:hypothetical protein